MAKIRLNIGKWALTNSKLVYYFVAILTLGGISSYYNMSKLEDPEVSVPQAVVITTYPGASPHDVELQVSDPLEKAILSMKGIDRVESRSSADLSMITVSLLSTVADNEMEQYWDILRRKVGDIQGKLPQGASESLVIDSYGDVFGMFYALSSDGYSNKELAEYSELIKREMLNIEGVSKVELYGITAPVINVSIHEDRIATLGISPMEVIQTLKGQNQTIYSGNFDSGNQRIRVSVGDNYRTVDQLGSVIIAGHEKDQIRLKDIASVEEDYSEPVRNALYFDGKPSIGISISALSGTDITKIGKKVEELFAKISAERLPAGIEYHKVFFQPERVSDAINNFIINLILSVIIVILVLMFSMGIRSGVLLGTTLIITVLGTILFLSIFGGTLQRVSLASFILAMGMLVDNAIVVVDGILIDLKNGRLRSRALSNIGQKTAMPLLGATLIAILAFFPIFLSPDTTGVYVRDLFVVLAVSLLLSWILSLTVVPLQAKTLLVKAKIKPESKLSIKMQSALRKILTISLRNRTIAVILALACVGLSVWGYKILPQSFFPDLNYNQLYIECKLPESYSSKATDKYITQINDYLLTQKDITHVTTSLGATASRYNLVRSIATPALSYADFIVEFTNEKTLVDAIPSLQKHLSDNFPEAYIRVKRYNLMYSKYPIEVMFKGPDPDILRSLTTEAQRIMSENENITLITSDWEQKVPILEVNYSQPIARAMGLSRQDVGISLLASTEGIPVETIYNGTTSQKIMIKCVDKNGEKINELETAPIFSMMPSLKSLDKQTITGLMTGAVSEQEIISSLFATSPLSQSIEGIKLKWEDPVIIRHDNQRVMRAQCNTIAGVGAEDARSQIIEAIEAIELPLGYTLSWQGEYHARSQSMKYLFANLPLAIILMIGILIMLFKDYRKPLIILLCVPLLFVGAVFGVLISGKAFGFVAICGILGLIGMMIKNGVVLMDEINLQIKSGKDAQNAILDSSAVRFRPVMMASMTTILGMIPLLSDDMFGSLAATIMGGLLLGTVVTLIFIPILYSIFFRIKIR
ncbi:MAG: efflux RND transporter permease subunit [Rikenellaceae bacterium]